jgi:hypothetical protein
LIRFGCFETIVRGIEMNKCLRGLGVVFVLMSANSAVFAVCDVELNRAISQYKVVSTDDYGRGLPQTNYDFIMKNGPQMQLEVLRFKIKENEKSINEASRERGMYPLARVYIAQLQNCLYELQISKKISNSNPQTTEALPAQQPQQPYKPGTSVLDRYLTAPKEDCDAIPQSYNVSDRQFAVSQCRLRNANRDKYAANANAASAKSDADAQATQSAKQQSQQAQQQAQQNQARADQARQGKRKTHDPAAEAHECISIDNAGSGNFGAFKNTCGYRVNFYTCNYKPRITQGGFNWSADFDCEKQQIGMHTPGAGVSVASHNRNTEMVYWFACKAPASPVDVTYVQGQGLSGRCN